MLKLRIYLGRRLLWREALLAQTPAERARGLMFSKRVAKPLLIRFASAGRRRNAIHSLFCPPFDAVFLDGSGKVVDIRPKIPPHQPLIIPARTCNLVIEVPPGESRKVRVGEKLSLR